MSRHAVIMLALTVLLLPGAALSQTVLKSDAADQVEVKVTVYNNNLGLIKDIREINLPVGQGELRFMDVASHIMPATVHAKSLDAPDEFAVLEQNYEYDLMNEKKLLDKYVGKKLKIVDWNRQQDRRETVEAILLSNNDGQVYRIGDEIYLGYPGYKVLPQLPEDLIAKPTLTWLYENNRKKPQKLEVSYLTDQISWRADYVLVLNEKDTAADLSGWVTLDNKSGAAYRDAQLKLVAGKVNRVEDEYKKAKFVLEEIVVTKSEAFEEKEFFEYHIYDLQRKTTIKDQQTKQVSLLAADGIEIKKELLTYGIQGYFNRKYSGQDLKNPVKVYIEFINAKNNRLGMPFPAGIMRLYKKDDDASLQFIGEDNISHTPKDEKVRLSIGEAFDVVAERIQTDYRQITSHLHESEWEISLRNRKEENITVGVIEPLFGNWEMIRNSHPYQKEDAFTLRFNVEVPKGKEVKINYRIRVGL